MSSSFKDSYKNINNIYMETLDIKETQSAISNLEIGNRTKNWLSRFFDLRENKTIILDDPYKVLSKTDIRDIITTDVNILKKLAKKEDSYTFEYK